MQTTPATPELVTQWKHTYSDYRERLHPNRRSGEELLAALKERYPLRELSGEVAKKVVCDSVLSNDVLREQLPDGIQPRPACFIVKRGWHRDETLRPTGRLLCRDRHLCRDRSCIRLVLRGGQQPSLG